MTLPTFLGIGVPRGGTTWLHTWLSSHPDVYVPSRRKEVRFFDRHYDRGLGWYESFFCPSEDRERYHAIGEISPQYLYSEECPRRIFETAPEIKLMISLRHPVDRAYSHYGFCVQRMNYRGSFRDFVESRPNALGMGFYSRYLERYLQLFDRGRILALVFEETFRDIDETERRVADFLAISPNGFQKSSGRVNPSTVPTFQALSGVAVKTGRRLRRWRLEGVVDLGRRLGMQRMISKGRKLPALSDDVRAEFGRRYEGEFEKLEECLHIDLSSWRQ